MSETMTAPEFEYRRPDESGDELTRGRYVREPGPGARHGVVAMRLFQALERHAPASDTGLLVFNTGFVLTEEPATVRIPDVAWIARARLPAEVPVSFWRLAPDLAVEVVSPGNRTSDMRQRVLDYLQSGTRAFWVVDPESRSVLVYRSLMEIRLLTERETLTAPDLLPGLAIRLESLFAW